VQNGLLGILLRPLWLQQLSLFLELFAVIDYFSIFILINLLLTVILLVTKVGEVFLCHLV